MTENSLKITYKIYLESDDINQSRILSTTSFMKNLFENCQNSYFKNVTIDDESDLEDFSLRFYVEQEVNEEECTAPKDAETFIPDMMEFLDMAAQAQSYVDMEGSFAIEYQGKKESYRFVSEGGQDYCEITKE